jgi:hypothetical protein
MYLGSIGPNAPAPLTYTLTETAPGTWMGTGTAPSLPGPYHYTVGLYIAGKRTVQDRDAWNIQVTGSQPGPPAAEALPPDIPLAPPFSYGNPVPAVFSAAGRTVRGSEVVSNARTDVSAGFVADFYSTRLPRAGWTVDGSSAPGPGATSFSIAATTSGGTRVCLIEYGASTVHIFYGRLTG